MGDSGRWFGLESGTDLGSVGGNRDAAREGAVRPRSAWVTDGTRVRTTRERGANDPVDRSEMRSERLAWDRQGRLARAGDPSSNPLARHYKSRPVQFAQPPLPCLGRFSRRRQLESGLIVSAGAVAQWPAVRVGTFLEPKSVRPVRRYVRPSPPDPRCGGRPRKNCLRRPVLWV